MTGRGRREAGRGRLLLLALVLAAQPLEAQAVRAGAASAIRDAVEAKLLELHARSGVPGISVGVAPADGASFGVAVGLADTGLGLPLTPGSRLLQGSVGKTYVAAVALQLVGEGALELDAPVARYLGDEPWFERLPNHEAVTVRQLMNHTSGIVRYEFDDRFITDLLAQPDKVWQPVELLAYLFDTAPPFAAGEGWEYSDTNYIVLGLIIERLTGRAYYDELRDRILAPLGLRNTVPSDRRRIAGLVQGYPGKENLFRLPDAVMLGGEFAINPQFEWTGGGLASTAEDLARWGRALYRGEAFDPALLPLMLDAVPARLGADAAYGLGVIIRPTALGDSWGHSGFFPGYLAELAYFPAEGFAVAVQVNSSDFGEIEIAPRTVLQELARIVAEAGAH